MATKLTSKAIENMKPGSARREIPDALLLGLYFVVQPSGAKSWAIRYRHGGKPRKMTLGTLAPSLPGAEPEPVLDGPLTLAGARTLARDKLREVAAGIDPATVKQEKKKAGPEEDKETFAAAVETWLRVIVVGPDETKPKQRQGNKVARETRRELVKRWGKKALQDITKRDVIAAIDEIAARGTPGMARNTLQHAKSFFAWAEARDLIDLSPAAPVKPKTLLGPKPIRTRVLADAELFVFWRATGRTGYPFGAMHRTLALTGCRLEEVAAARWREFHPELVRLLRSGEPIDWAKVRTEWKLWTVGAERFKSDAPHMVPLSDAACAVLEAVPFFTKGDYLFTTTEGERPVSGFSKAKKRLDRAMLRTFKALARMRGEEPAAAEFPNFTNHDLRRTLRTRLSGLQVSDEVAEMVIGHAKKGLQRVYDQHRYIEEMRAALEKWAGALRDITTPAPSNVVPLRRAGE